MPTAEAPLPCPYCGSTSVHPLRQAHARGEPFAVMCCRMDVEDTDNLAEECGAQGPYSASAEGAVLRWNAVARCMKALPFMDAAVAEWVEWGRGSKCGDAEDMDACSLNDKERCDAWRTCRAMTAWAATGETPDAPDACEICDNTGTAECPTCEGHGTGRWGPGMNLCPDCQGERVLPCKCKADARRDGES